MTRSALIAAIVLLAACDDDSQTARPPVALSEAPTDSPFRAIVQAVAERSEGRVLVDPRTNSGREYADVPRAAGVADERGRILHDLRIPRTQAFPLLEGCDGYLTAPSVRDVSGCPEESETVLAVGEIKRGEGDEWTVPITIIRYTKGGFSGESADVILRRTNLGWEAVKITNSIVWE